VASALPLRSLEETTHVRNNANFCTFLHFVNHTKPVSSAGFQVYDERKSQGAAFAFFSWQNGIQNAIS
jgi:hypothetical protein